MSRTEGVSRGPALRAALLATAVVMLLPFSAAAQNAPRDRYTLLSGLSLDDREAQSAALELFMSLDGADDSKLREIHYQIARSTLGDDEEARKQGEANAVAHRQRGEFLSRHVRRITIYKDPPEAARKGIYAAIDFSGAYQNLEIYCGYMVLFKESPESTYRFVRLEEATLRRDLAEQLMREARLDELDRARGQMLRRCPGGHGD